MPRKGVNYWLLSFDIYDTSYMKLVDARIKYKQRLKVCSSLSWEVTYPFYLTTCLEAQLYYPLDDIVCEYGIEFNW